MSAIVQAAEAGLPPADVVRSAAELYLAAVRALGGEYRGADETIVKVRDGSGCGEDGCGDGCESAGYMLVTLALAAGGTAVTRRSTVTVAGLRALSPGRGDGTRMLLTLANLADYHGVTLELMAAPLDAMGRKAKMEAAKRLCAWYRRFGFGGTFFLMTRKPNTVARG